MINQKLSLYIPHVFINITKERICDVFSKQSIGEVDRIDFVPKKGKDGKDYNSAFVHMKKWCTNESVSNLQHKIFNNDKTARIVYDDPWFWNLYENVNPRSASELKMEETIANLTKTVQILTDQYQKMDAFTQYLEDEVNQLNAQVANLNDSRASYPMMVPFMNQVSPTSSMNNQVDPTQIANDVAAEFERARAMSDLSQGPMELGELADSTNN